MYQQHRNSKVEVFDNRIGESFIFEKYAMRNICADFLIFWWINKWWYGFGSNQQCELKCWWYLRDGNESGNWLEYLCAYWSFPLCLPLVPGWSSLVSCVTWGLVASFQIFRLLAILISHFCKSTLVTSLHPSFGLYPV